MWVRFFALVSLMSVALSSPATAQQNLLQSLQGAIGNATGSGSSASPGDPVGSLSIADIGAGLREALRVGTEAVVSQVGATDGYNSDPDIHIPLPPELQNIQGLLKKFGLSSLADEVELKLNRAAEVAAPKTKELIWKAITEMTLEDAKRIYDGPNDAATQYFKRVSSADLANVIKPIVDQSLAEVGAIASYDRLMGEYSSMPFVPDVKGNLTNHAVNMALEGLFFYLAKEEAGIRQNPAKRTTDLLARVFSG